MRLVGPFLWMLLISSGAFAECVEPVKYKWSEATSHDYGGDLFSAVEPGMEVSYLEKGKCYFADRALGRRGKRGYLYVNNYVGAYASGKKHDLTMVQMRLSAKTLDKGSFGVRLSRSGSDRKCEWFRDEIPQGEFYLHGEIHAPVGSADQWNAAHDLLSDPLKTDKLTRGKFHAAASQGGISTFDINVRKKFRIPDEILDKFDVDVLVRLQCFDAASKSESGMVDFEVVSGESGVILSYFSASSDLSGTVKLCREPHCKAIESLQVGNPYSGIIAWLMGRS